MTAVMKYDFQVGTEVTLFGNKLAYNGRTDAGYQFTDLESATMTVVPFRAFVDYLQLPGIKLDTNLPQTGNRLHQRLGGHSSALELPFLQQEFGHFNHAICQAMNMLRSKIREETGNNNFDLSIRKMDQDKNRKFVRDIAQTLFGQKIRLETEKGHEWTKWALYKGRTLMKYFTVFEGLHPSESPLDALTSLDHLKGNHVARITYRVKELMTQAWNEIGFDTKESSAANVMIHLEMLIFEDNKIRKRNGLKLNGLPGSSTLVAHRHYLLTPTEFMIATKGEVFTRNKRGRGSTDIRALMIGECVEIDECNASLMSSAKERGIWENLAQPVKDQIKEIDKIITERLTILVMIDVASRMPLAWVISDQPKAVATLALFRMATRDKTREKLKYGCAGDPVGMVGLGHVKNDNGPGLRNSAVVTALIATGSMNTITRAYASTDKPYVERMFGTTESVLFKILHGYTGRKPGDLPGYDAEKSGVLDLDELYEILTKFMIDEYPSMQHMGVGMGGRRPYEVYQEILATRDCFPPIDPNQRRIHLGWEENVTPSDEGVRVFKGIWFNSDELQTALDLARIKGRKVSVFVDPENISCATVLIPGVHNPVEVQLQITAFADMTVPETLALMAEWRRENPKVAEVHNDRLMKLRRERFDMLRKIGVERNLPRSYSTVEECQAKARAVFAGARVIPDRGLPGTTAPDQIMNIGSSENVFSIGLNDRPIDGTATEIDRTDDSGQSFSASSAQDVSATPSPGNSKSARTMTPGAWKPKSNSNATSMALGRPKIIKDLE